MPNAVGTNVIGPSFADEMATAGLANLSVSWSAAGSFIYGSGVSDAQKALVAAVYAAHNPLISGLKAYAANARYLKEVGGIVVGGIKIATDRESQGMLTGAAALAQLNSGFTTNWKADDGTFVALGAAQIIGVAQAVGNHVSTSFSTEAQIVAEITATPPTITTTDQIDAVFAAMVG
jgi:Domain of unknown function (DUF4376)